MVTSGMGGLPQCVRPGGLLSSRRAPRVVPGSKDMLGGEAYFWGLRSPTGGVWAQRVQEAEVLRLGRQERVPRQGGGAEDTAPAFIFLQNPGQVLWAENATGLPPSPLPSPSPLPQRPAPSALSGTGSPGAFSLRSGTPSPHFMEAQPSPRE